MKKNCTCFEVGLVLEACNPYTYLMFEYPVLRMKCEDCMQDGFRSLIS